MFDRRVLEILDFDFNPDGQMASGDREHVFSDYALDSFSEVEGQAAYLTNFGFGIVRGVPAVVPFNLSRRAGGLSHGLPPSPTRSHFEDEGQYPILAGSAVFLGAEHDLCEDLDFVMYLEVGDEEDGRYGIAEKLVQQVMQSQPHQVEISVNRKKCAEKWPATGDEIPELIKRHIPLTEIKETHRAIGNISYIHLEWPAGAILAGKSVSLRIHHVHSTSKNADIHPYQEVHGCNAMDFFHRNKHWLTSSFGTYFNFLRHEIAEGTVESRPIKAAKRAIPLSGMVGNLETQTKLVDLLGAYGSEGDSLTNRQKTLEQIKKIVHDFRIEIEREVTRWGD